MKVIETEYKGYRFRSRLEARWAVFFDACGVKWEYEPEGFDLGDGLYYLPDFLLHDVAYRCGEAFDLWLEVKGIMNETDVKKIVKFASARKDAKWCGIDVYKHPILIVTTIPEENELWNHAWAETNDSKSPPFNFLLVDGDYYAALPCISLQGKFAVEGSDYTEYVNVEATEKAYRLARQARFEHR